MKVGKQGRPGGALVCTFLPKFCDARCPAGSVAIPAARLSSDPRASSKDCVVLTPPDNTGYACVLCKPKPCNISSSDCGAGETFDAANCRCVKKPNEEPSIPGPGGSQAAAGHCVANCSGLRISYISECPQVDRPSGNAPLQCLPKDSNQVTIVTETWRSSIPAGATGNCTPCHTGETRYLIQTTRTGVDGAYYDADRGALTVRGRGGTTSHKVIGCCCVFVGGVGIAQIAADADSYPPHDLETGGVRRVATSKERCYTREF